tara:strand:- start:8929 stop:9714 length:786 start_codon:yes stop_codon:yes gene_type:complete
MIKDSILRIASSNIRFANPADGDNDWHNRCQLWRSLIDSFSPSILGTQEGRKPQLDEVTELLPTLVRATAHRDWIDERMYPCLFFDPKIFSLHASGDAWLSETPEIPGSKDFESAFPRLCTWASLIHLNTNKKFFVVNTHLDHVKDETRAHQIDVLIDTIEKENDECAPIILMGDFNEDAFSNVRKKINTRLPSLIDCWQSFGHAEESSHHKFCGHNENGARIDWILTDKSIEAVSISLDKSHQGKIWPSDHFIVKAEFKL